MGRPAKPFALKLLDGNRGRHDLTKPEPKPDPLASLDPPAWLPEPAAAVWRELAPGLAKLGLLTAGDVDALATLCSELASFRDLTKLIAEAPPDTELQQLSAWRRWRKSSFDSAARLLCQFGMTPSARAGLSISPPKESTANEKYFS